MSDTPWLTIIGMGEDGVAGLSARSQAALAQADIVMARPRHLERLVVAAVLLRLLGHQPNIAGVAHRLPVKLAVLSGG